MGSMGGLRIIENTIVSMQFSWFVRCDGEHGRAQNHWKYKSIHAFLMICSVGWGAWAGSESLKIQWHPFIFHDLFGGMGSMGRLRIIANTIVSMHLHDLFGGMGSMGGLRIIENTIVSMHFSWFVCWDGEHGRAQNHWQYNSIHAFFMIRSVGWGAWAGSESLKIQ